MRAKVDFKSEFANNISDVKLIFDLPSSCDFVDNSVMAGNTISSYTIGDNRIEVELTNINDLVRFCVVPMEGGSCNPSAFVQFELNGEEIRQPIGNAGFEAKSLEINVPSVTASKEIAVSGVCKGNSLVEIYDNDVLIATVNSLAHGAWSTKCELNNAYNLSTHNIYAKVVLGEMILQSETKEVVYDMNAVQVSKVTMYYNNYELIYDFINPNNKSNYWVYNGNINYTYTIEFTDNSPEKVMNVILYVHTLSGKIFPYEAEYNEEKDLWIVNCELRGEYPVNVSVDFDTISYGPVSRQILTYSEFNYSEHYEGHALINSKFDEFEMLFEYSNITDEEFDSIYNALTLMSFAHDDVVINGTLEEYLLLSEELLQVSDQILNSPDSSWKELSSMNKYESFDLHEYELDGYLEIRSTEMLNPDILIELGYTKINVDDNSEVYQLVNDSLYELIDFYNETHYIMAFNTDNFLSLYNRGMGIQSLIDMVNDYDKQFSVISGIIGTINDLLLNQIPNFFDTKIAAIEAAIADNRSAREGLRYFEGISPNPDVNMDIADMVTELKGKNIQLGKERAQLLKNYGAVMDAISKVTSILSAFLNAYSMGSNANEYIDLWYEVPSCICDMSKTEELKNSILNAGIRCAGKDLANIIADIYSIHMLYASASSAIPTGGTSLILGVATISLSVAKYFVNEWANKEFEKERVLFSNQITALANDMSCNECPPPPPPTPNPNNPKPKPGPGQHKPNQPDDEVSIDPSGFVYEGVSSNRVEGVMASCYYKEFIEDMYGDIIENVVLWDAEAYAQENPLFTDENGMYRWDVPQGLWQVKFEKEGYETTYSDWLPVPPPQLEVNIPIVQYSQPNVIFARAYQNAIEVHFDKYMMPSFLTTDNITVTVDGENVAGSIEFLDEEACYEGMNEKYVSKVRFNADEPFQAEEVTLTVESSVRSYANIRMQDDFTQTFTVEVEIQKIVCPPSLQLTYNEETTIEVSVIPAVASKGKTLNIVSQTPLILSVNTSSVVINEEGKAQITLKGELPGSASLSFNVEGYDINAQTSVKVEQKKIYDSNQTMTLNEGWNWVSTYLDIDGNDGLNRIQKALGGNAQQIKSQLSFSSYNDGNWYGLMESASTEEMYMIMMLEEAQMSLNGNLVDPAEHPITLQNNWTWFGYILNEDMSLEDGLANFTPNSGDYVKSQLGFNTYYNGSWYGETELSFEVGKGYMYRNTSGAAKTLVYPSNNSKGRYVGSTSVEKHWNVDVNKYPTNMSIIAVVNVDDEEMTDYEIGAFSDGECRGSALNRYLLFLTVHGEGNDEITFRYYDVVADEEYDYVANEMIYYSADATIGTMPEPYTINFGTTNVNDHTYCSFEVYPNPVDKNNEIHLGTICEKVEVYNSIGVKVAEYSDVNTIDGIEVPGVYIINAIGKNSVKYCRLIVK